MDLAEVEHSPFVLVQVPGSVSQSSLEWQDVWILQIHNHFSETQTEQHWATKQPSSDQKSGVKPDWPVIES